MGVDVWEPMAIQCIPMVVRDWTFVRGLDGVAGLLCLDRRGCIAFVHSSGVDGVVAVVVWCCASTVFQATALLV